MEHHFNTKIAKEYGIEEAILLHHFYYWITQNAANKKNFNNGLYWTYNSRKAYAQFFGYISEAKIFRTIKRLEDAGLIIKGNFNTNRFDKTNWYALTPQGLNLLKENGYEIKPFNGITQNDTIDCIKSNNGACQSEQSITDNNTTYNNTDNNKETSSNEEAKKEGEEIKKTPLSNPAEGTKYEKLFAEWLAYRKDIKKPINIQKSLQSCFNKLVKMSNDDLAIATAIVENSIANQYQGLFAPKEKPQPNQQDIQVDDLFFECWSQYGKVGNEQWAKKEWVALSTQEKALVKRHSEEYVHYREKRYIKKFERYLRDKEFNTPVRDKNGVIVLTPIINEYNYYPATGFGIDWNDVYNYYLYKGAFLDDLYDGYDDNERPHGATIMLHNARGIIKWDANKKKWVDEKYFDLPF